MKQTRRNSILILALLICACTPMIWAQLNTYWQQQMNPATFHFHYQECQAFTCNNWDDYLTKTSSLDLLNEKMTMLTITKNTVLDTPLSLACSFTSTAIGTELTASGQYCKAEWIGGERKTVASGTPFDIPTDGGSKALDMTKIMWANWSEAGQIAYTLEITFTVDTSGIQEAGNNPTGDYTFTVDLNVSTD